MERFVVSFFYSEESKVVATLRAENLPQLMNFLKDHKGEFITADAVGSSIGRLVNLAGVQEIRIYTVDE
jgi:hypothetical protein